MIAVPGGIDSVIDVYHAVRAVISASVTSPV